MMGAPAPGMRQRPPKPGADDPPPLHTLGSRSTACLRPLPNLLPFLRAQAALLWVSLCSTLSQAHSSPGVRSKTQLPQQLWRLSKQPQTDDEKLNWGSRMLPGNDTKMTKHGNKAPSYPDQELRGRGAPLPRLPPFPQQAAPFLFT